MVVLDSYEKKSCKYFFEFRVFFKRWPKIRISHTYNCNVLENIVNIWCDIFRFFIPHCREGERWVDDHGDVLFSTHPYLSSNYSGYLEYFLKDGLR
jgi:hypothetical protein